MQVVLAFLWRARLAIAAGLLAISAGAIVKGHHDAWAGDKFYTASLTDDLSFVGSTAAAFGALWVGAYSPAYVLCLSLFFGYQAILNVTTLLTGGFVIRGSHGCFACMDNAQLFVSGMLDYVFAGLLATAVARAIAMRWLPQPPGRAQANLAFLILLPVAWFRHAFYLDALNQPVYVRAQLLRLSPYVAAALLAAVIAARVFIRHGPCEGEPRHVGTRISVVIFLIVGLPVMELLFYSGIIAAVGTALFGVFVHSLAPVFVKVFAGFSR